MNHDDRRTDLTRRAPSSGQLPQPPQAASSITGAQDRLKPLAATPSTPAGPTTPTAATTSRANVSMA